MKSLGKVEKWKLVENVGGMQVHEGTSKQKFLSANKESTILIRISQYKFLLDFMWVHLGKWTCEYQKWKPGVNLVSFFTFLDLICTVTNCKKQMLAGGLKLLFPCVTIKIFVYSFPPAYALLPHFQQNSCYYFPSSFKTVL